MSWLPQARWAPGVHAKLVEMLRTAPAGSVAAFDWDDTCIRGDIGERLLADVAPPAKVARYEQLMEDVDQKKAYEWLTLCFAGETPMGLRQRTQRVLTEARREGAIAFREEVRDLIWAMQRNRWEVYVVSGSPGTVVETAAQHYGVPAHRVLAMRLKLDADTFCPVLTGPVTYRGGKVEALRERTRAPLRFAAGDSGGDLDLLEAADHVLVMDRGVTELSERAHQRGWWVQQAF